MKMTHRLKGMETSFRDLSGPKAGLNLLPIFINIPGTPKCTISLVDGGRLRTFLCETMHMLCSSGYTLSGIYNDDLSWSPKTQSRIQIHRFRPVCAPSQKKVVLAAFLVVIHQTIWNS